MSLFQLWSIDGKSRPFTSVEGYPDVVGTAFGDMAFVLKDKLLLDYFSLLPRYTILDDGLVYELVDGERAEDPSYTTIDPDGDD